MLLTLLFLLLLVPVGVLLLLLPVLLLPLPLLLLLLGIPLILPLSLVPMMSSALADCCLADASRLFNPRSSSFCRALLTPRN